MLTGAAQGWPPGPLEGPLPSLGGGGHLRICSAVRAGRAPAAEVSGSELGFSAGPVRPQPALQERWGFNRFASNSGASAGDGHGLRRRVGKLVLSGSETVRCPRNIWKPRQFTEVWSKACPPPAPEREASGSSEAAGRGPVWAASPWRFKLREWAARLTVKHQPSHNVKEVAGAERGLF